MPKKAKEAEKAKQSISQKPIFTIGDDVSRESMKQPLTGRLPILNTHDGRFVNTNTDKNPSYTNRNLSFSKEGKIYEQAFTLLSATSAVSVEQLSISLSAIDKKDGKVKFLKACYEVEESGSNPTMHPRPQVMEFLTDSLFELGESGGIGRVTKSNEKIVSDIKPVRFVV